MNYKDNLFNRWKGYGWRIVAELDNFVVRDCRSYHNSPPFKPIYDIIHICNNSYYLCPYMKCHKCRKEVPKKLIIIYNLLKLKSKL